ncbi:MAG TPA: hypothetical protein VEX86_24830, partial [Longimicrobium sp.]|nr:hypothetical protein [Longimicrobium sp.]
WGSYATSVNDLQTVGFEAPTTLKNYTWAATSIGDGVCLAKSPTGASHSGRSINFTTGAISDC